MSTGWLLTRICPVFFSSSTESIVEHAETIRYTHPYTYDILPASRRCTVV
jgi:hypothetical protein